METNVKVNSHRNFCGLMDCSLPGSSVHGIFQARVLEWVAIAFSRRSSWSRDWTQVSRIVGRRFTIWATRELGGTKTQQWPQDWKRSVFIPKKGSAKECSNYCTIALISYASKVVLKILQTRLQQYVNHELPDVQPGFRKGRGTRDQITNIIGSLKKQESSRKTLPPLYWLCQSLWLCGSQ